MATCHNMFGKKTGNNKEKGVNNIEKLFKPDSNLRHPRDHQVSTVLRIECAKENAGNMIEK